ncbi:MAG: DUF3082 domain-containing protein [Prochlorothrix sp.]|nr:DUF3082 domain-containing protein [Prochlorothrix sp.]
MPQPPSSNADDRPSLTPLDDLPDRPRFHREAPIAPPALSVSKTPEAPSPDPSSPGTAPPAPAPIAPSPATPDPAPLGTAPIAPKAPPTVFQCVSGSALAGGFAVLLYRLTQSMAQSFADKPIQAKSYLAANIGAAVRTLVVGSVTLATFLFAISALGLLALGLQTLITGRKTPIG